VVFGASSLVEDIPKAVLAGIAIKVGMDIIDWGFLRRAHLVSKRGAIIMYSVILMTVFVDLITAVGIGLFVANILTIRRLADLQSEYVRVIEKQGDAQEQDWEKMQPDSRRILFDAGNGVTLLQLSGPLIFGAAQTLTRQQTLLAKAKALVIDMSEVPHIGVSTALVLEHIIRDLVQDGGSVYLAGMQKQPAKRFSSLGLEHWAPRKNWVDDCGEALKRAQVQASKIPENSSHAWSGGSAQTIS
jgi:SulP family sulfate permease